MENNIEIENLKISFKSTHDTVAVKDVSVVFEENKITGIIGESGSGKSLLAMSILQLLSESANIQGKIKYKGENLLDLDHKNMRKIRGKEIGLIPQNPMESLNKVLKVKIQLEEILKEHFPEMSSSQRLEEIELNLRNMGFENPKSILNSYPMQLSGGMMQRVLSIFGVLARPKWVIADEPTKGLDSILRKQVYETLINISKNRTKSMIIITHDLSLAYNVCDKILVMLKGEVIEEGSPKEIFYNSKHEYTKKLVNAMPGRMFSKRGICHDS